MRLYRTRSYSFYLLFFLLMVALLTTAITVGCDNTPPVNRSQPENKKTNEILSFTLPDINGNRVSIEQWRGQMVLLNFWTSWCIYCRQEMPYLNRFNDIAGRYGWAVVTVNVTAQERNINSVLNYVQKENLNFPVLLDTEGKVTNELGIRAFPTSLIIDRDGKIKSIKIGMWQEDELMNLLQQK